MFYYTVIAELIVVPGGQTQVVVINDFTLRSFIRSLECLPFVIRIIRIRIKVIIHSAAGYFNPNKTRILHNAAVFYPIDIASVICFYAIHLALEYAIIVKYEQRAAVVLSQLLPSCDHITFYIEVILLFNNGCPRLVILLFAVFKICLAFLIGYPAGICIIIYCLYSHISGGHCFRQRR